ncbi:uncharacterized protein LOC119286946 isoform X3 [Triticum dicoccoides]|uniref:uncharacterized protein n=1 Tax=Triticum aestivum TaxID=4565 RepID=UPI00188FF72B|nr:uncharacterized protein LOC119286946 isoform X3 [Triticum dicoccoides]XP_044367934.1 uncharacterized protein LOC123090673 [Triticum aestivum]
MSAALGVEGWPEAAARRAVLQEASRRVTASPAGGRVAVRIDPQPPSLLVAMVPCFHAWKAIDSKDAQWDLVTPRYQQQSAPTKLNYLLHIQKKASPVDNQGTMTGSSSLRCKHL